jgi:hypothetical protein
VAFAKPNDMEIQIHSVLMLAPRMSHIVCAEEDGKIRAAHPDRSLDLWCLQCGRQPFGKLRDDFLSVFADPRE